MKYKVIITYKCNNHLSTIRMVNALTETFDVLKVS